MYDYDILVSISTQITLLMLVNLKQAK